MLRYVYDLDYTIEVPERIAVGIRDRGLEFGIELSIQLSKNADMYSMGDKYGIDGLKGIASEKFATTLKQYVKWGNVEVGSLCAIIEHIFTSTPESDKGLRDQIRAYAKIHIKRLLPLKDFQKVLAEVPQLSYQLLAQEMGSGLSENVSSKVLPAKKRKLAATESISAKKRR